VSENAREKRALAFAISDAATDVPRKKRVRTDAKSGRAAAA
jgi:hypothetical protein